MSQVEYFVWLAVEAAGGLLQWWPVTLSSGAFVALTLRPAVREPKMTPSDVAWLLLPVVVPIALLLWGVAFRETGSASLERSTWQEHGVSLLLLAHVPLVAISTWRTQRRRLFAFAVGVFIAHYSFWAAFLAEMSVRNDWL
jgi:hypothetical protein